MAKWLDKYEQGGLVLKQKTKDNYGTKPNVNDVKVSAGPNFVGEGYTAYNWKSPAWGGQFAMGGSLPGSVGFMYARTQNPAPANGKYTKKTLASAQNGQEMKFYQEGLDFKPKTISQDGRNISKELKKEAEEKLERLKKPRATISQYTPKKGEAERLDREKLQRIAEDNAPLNKMAASKGAKNLQDAILFATNVMGVAEGAGALKGLLKKSPKFALAKAATTVEEDAAINAAKPSLAELWKKDEKIPTNYSGFTKEEVLKKAKNKNEITKLPDEEFKKTVLKPTGEISTYDEKDAASYFTGEDEIFPMTNQEYIDKFNSRLDLLNEIIEKNNKTGIPYSVNNLSDKGVLMFNTPETPENMLGKTWFHTDITPGEWRGTVKDINNPKYLKSIPGLNMRDASMTVFGDGIPRRGTGTYKSINEYLRKLDLGRVKAGFNSQSDHAQTLWENAVKKGNAVGYFNDPNTIHAAMKKHGGWLNKYK